MRFALAQICIGAAAVVVGLHLCFMAFANDWFFAAALALFGALVGVLLVVSGDREWQDLLNEQALKQIEGQVVDVAPAVVASEIRQSHGSQF